MKEELVVKKGERREEGQEEETLRLTEDVKERCRQCKGAVVQIALNSKTPVSQNLKEDTILRR